MACRHPFWLFVSHVSFCCTAATQNVQHDLLLGGHASVAIIKPIKVATLHTLAKLWNMLHVARRDEAAKRASGGKAATRGPEYESADGAHMGLTHDDVLKKVRCLTRAVITTTH